MEYQDPTTRRRGMSGWVIGLIACGGCCLVAVVIIPILAAILFPVFAKARESARKATCQANLKQISVSMKLYQSDWDSKAPSAAPGMNDNAFETTLGAAGGSGGRAAAWPAAIRPYVQGSSPTSVFVCPSDSGRTLSYYYKHAVNLAGKMKLGESDFAYPGDQIMLYERQPFHYGGGPIVDGASVNVAFVDGHVQTVRMVDVASDKEPGYFNYIDISKPKAAKVKQPYWDPRYCYDKLY